MEKNKIKLSFVILTVLVWSTTISIFAKSGFTHPGGLHSQADLDRMKNKVTEGVHPWIDGWNQLLKDPLAQNTYKASPSANMNRRQDMSRDAHAAYLNAIRWYVSGDESYAKCAVGIYNTYSSVIDQVPFGSRTEIVGLGGIGIGELAMGAEIMRLYEGWNKADFERFKTMMVQYFYPICHDFLVNHNGACLDYYWANWDANNLTALIAIGVLCDNEDIFNEGIEYYKNGAGTGCIKHAVCYIHEDNLGQWQESGRDQEHAQLGVGLLGTACQIAWNQGIDLFGYDNNRLLAGAEYVAKYNMMLDVPYKFYSNCQPSNNKWAAINGRGRLDDRPVWEMIYNHYVNRMGLDAPNVKRMAELTRPEQGSRDHFGYGTLTFTLEESPCFPLHIPGKITALKAVGGIGKMFLTWQAPEDTAATGYVIQRSTKSNGEFKTIASWDANTYTEYTDKEVTDGQTYFYRVAAVNRTGTGEYSEVTSAMSCAAAPLPSGWSCEVVGASCEKNAQYAHTAGETFIVSGNATRLGGTKDNVVFCSKKVKGDCEMTCRISDISGSLSKSGLMIRESLDEGAATVCMTLGEGGGRFARMGYREAAGANMSSTLGNAYTWLPAWFKLKRSGNTFVAYESSDGAEWFKVDSVEIPMKKSVYIGMGLTSRNKDAENITTFDFFDIKE